MQFVLKSNEGVVTVLVELDVAQDCTGNIRSNLGGVRQDLDNLRIGILGLDDSEVWRLHVPEEDVQVEGNALEAEHIIPVCSDFNLELRGFLFAVDDRTFLILGVFIKLDAIVEAEIFELFLGKSAGRQVRQVSMLLQMRSEDIPLFSWQLGHDKDAKAKDRRRRRRQKPQIRDEEYVLLAERFEELVLVNSDGRHGEMIASQGSMP